MQVCNDCTHCRPSLGQGKPDLPLPFFVCVPKAGPSGSWLVEPSLKRRLEKCPPVWFVLSLAHNIRRGVERQRKALSGCVRLWMLRFPRPLLPGTCN